METQVVQLDTGILIEFFRNKDKSKSILYQLSSGAYEFKVAAISQYEILLGANLTQLGFWNSFFDKVEILPLNSHSAVAASEIYKQLKSENKLIDIADILIASIALTNQIPLATLNQKHFRRIKNLELLNLAV